MGALKVSSIKLSARNMRRSHNALSRLVNDRKLPFVVKRVAAKCRKSFDPHVEKLGLEEANLLEKYAKSDKEGNPIIDSSTAVISFKDADSRKKYVAESRALHDEVSAYKVFRVNDSVLDQFTLLDFDPEDESESASTGISAEWLEHVLWMFDDDQGEDLSEEEREAEESKESPAERKRRKAAEATEEAKE